jgi:hypothetical protein
MFNSKNEIIHPSRRYITLNEHYIYHTLSDEGKRMAILMLIAASHLTHFLPPGINKRLCLRAGGSPVIQPVK